MSALRIVLAHGIRVADTNTSIGRLDNEFESRGIRSARWRYGRVSAFLTRFGNRARAQQFLTFCHYLAGDGPIVVVAHSMGCRLANDAAWLADENGDDSPFKHIVMISPALDRKTILAPGIEKCDVFYTPSDWTVRLSSYMPCHPFGRMGAFGPDSQDPRWRRRVSGYPQIQGHSKWNTGHGLSFLRHKLVIPLITEYTALQLRATPCG